MWKRWIMVMGFSASFPEIASADVMRVQIERARLLTRPSAFSPAKAFLKYGTEIEPRGKTGAYYRVSTAKGEGYLHVAVVTRQRLVMVQKTADAAASSEEVAMATKGFNAQVEASYREDHPDLRFDLVDDVEAKVDILDPVKRFARFRRVGKLGEYLPIPLPPEPASSSPDASSDEPTSSVEETGESADTGGIE